MGPVRRRADLIAPCGAWPAGSATGPAIVPATSRRRNDPQLLASEATAKRPGGWFAPGLFRCLLGMPPPTPSSVLAPLAGVDLPSDVGGKPGDSGFGRKDKLSNRSDKVAEHRAVQR